MSETLTRTQQAVEYGRAGIKVFPVHWNPGGDDHKAPMRGYAWRISATSDPGEIAQDFTLAEMDWGIDNVAIAWATGEDGKVVIDVDRKTIPAWTQAFDWAAAINETGKGWHFICDFPTEFEPGNGTTELKRVHGNEASGIDVRGKGGYIVIAAPDRPGLDVTQLERCQPFPRPDWLVPYGGPIDALDMAELAAFRDRYNHSNMPNAIHGIETRLTNFDERRAQGIIESRHNKAIDVMVLAGEDAIRGLYPWREAVGLVKTWWNQVTADEPVRQGREWRNIVAWAAGRAQANLHPPAEAANEDESLVPNDDGITGLLHVVDFATLWDGDHVVDWLVEGVWERSRSVLLYAKWGEGKSEFSVYIAACMALGIHPWSGQPMPPVKVLYIDYEMTDADVRDRISDFGWGPEQDWSHLIYGNHPSMPALNTAGGAAALKELVAHFQPEAVVIDTYSSATEGNENDPESTANFNRFVLRTLRDLGVGCLYLDHPGKDAKLGALGGTRKNTAVDVVWEQKRARQETHVQLTNRKNRQGTMEKVVFFERQDGDVVRFGPDTDIGNIVLTAAEVEKAKQLDKIGADVSWTQAETKAALRAAGIVPGKNKVLVKAMTYRRDRDTRGYSGHSVDPVLRLIEGGNNLSTGDPDDD